MRTIPNVCLCLLLAFAMTGCGGSNTPPISSRGRSEGPDMPAEPDAMIVPPTTAAPDGRGNARDEDRPVTEMQPSDKSASESPPVAAPAAPAANDPFGLLGSQPEVGESATKSADALLQSLQQYPAAHFAQNGRILASERNSGRISVFDVTNRSVLATIFGKPIDVSLLRYEPRLRLLAGSTGNGGLQIWQILPTDGLDRFQQRRLSEQAELVLLPGHRGGTLDAAFSPTRDELASVGADGLLRLWLPFGDKSPKQLDDTSSGIPQIAAVSGDGQVVAAITRPGSLTVWKVDSGESTSFVVPDFQYTKLRLDQTGSLAVLGEQLGRLMLVGLDGSRPVEIQAFNEAVSDLRIAADPPTLTALSVAGKIKSLSLPYQPSSVVYAAQRIRGRLALSRDRRQIAFPSANGIIRVRNLEGRRQQSDLTTGMQVVESLCFAGGGQVAVGGAAGEVEFLSETGIQTRFDSGDSNVIALVAADEQSTAVLTADHRLGLIKSSAPRLASPSQPLEVSVVAFDSENRVAVCCSPGGKLTLLDLSTSQVSAAWDSGLTNVTSLDVSVASGIVVAGDGSGEIALWQIRDPENRSRLGSLNSAVTALKIVPESGFVCAGGRGGEVCTLPFKQAPAQNPPFPIPSSPALLQIAADGRAGVFLAEGKPFNIDASTGQLSAIDVADAAVRATISADGSQTAILGIDKRLRIFGQGNHAYDFAQTTGESIVDVKFQHSTGQLLLLTADSSVFAQPVTPTDWLAGRGLKDVTAAVVSPDNSATALALGDGTIVICRSGKSPQSDTRVQLPRPAAMLAWLSPDQLVASTVGLPEFLLINVSTGVISPPVTSPAPSITAFCGGGSRAEIWFLADGRPGVLTESGGTLRIREIPWQKPPADQIAPLEQTVVIKSGDQLFRLSEDGSGSATPLSEFSGVAGIVCSDDGKSLLLWTVAGSLERFDGRARVSFGQTRFAPIAGRIAAGGRNCVVWDAQGTAEVFSLNPDSTPQPGRQFQVSNPTAAWWLPNSAGMAFAAANGDVKVEPATAAMIIKGDGTAADTLQVSDDGSCLLLLGPSVGRCVAETGNLRFQFPTVGMKYFQLAADGGAAWMAGEDGSIRRVDEVSTVERKLDGSVCGLVADRVAGTLSVVFRKTDAMTILQPDTLEPMGNRSLKVEPVAAFSGGPGQLLAVNEQNQASVIPLQPVPEVLPTTELHQKACLSIVFHEGHIWSAGADGAVIRWPQTGTQAFELLRHSQPLTAILAAPNSRGLLAVDVAGAILQAPLRGEAVSEVLPGASGRSRILFHADREGTLHFLEGREIISWDPSGSIVSFRTVHELRGACMDARGTGLLALDVTGRVITIERPSLRIISPKSSTFTALHRTATGLLAAVDASSVSLYSADGELKGSVPMNKRIGAASGCCSEADLIAVNGPEGEIRLIDLGSRQTLREFNCGRQPTLISPDRNGEHVLIGFGGNLLEEWDAVNGMRLRQLSGHETLVLAAEYLDAGFGAVSADSSGEIRRWPDTDTQVSQVAMEQEAKAALLVGHGDVALFGKDGRLRFAARGTDEVRASAGIECVSGSVAVAEATGVVAWLVQGPENQRMLTVRNNGKTPPVNLPVSFDAVEPALSADGSIAALVVGDGIDVINLNTGLTSRRRLTNVARVLSVSPEMLIYLGRDGIIRCLGSLQLAEVTVSSSAATAVAWNEKGDTLVTGAEDGLIRIWSRSDDALKQVAQFTAGAPVRQLLFHGNRVFARSKSATVFAWLVNADGLPTAETPTEIVEAEPVDLICWDASREVLAAACRSGLGLWRVPADGSPPYKVRTQLGHEQPVTAAAVDSDAAVLMSVDASGLVAVNPLPAGADLRKTLEPVVLMSGRLNALKDVGDESDADAGSKRGRGQRKSAAEDRFRDYRLRQMQATEDGVTNLADDVSTASAEMIHQARLAGLLASVARIEPSLGLAGAELDQQSGVNDRSLSLPKSEEQATLGMRLKEADALMARLEKEAAAMPANERSAPRTSLLLELMQQIVKERRQLIDEIHQGAVESFLASQVSRRLTDAERERLKRVLQQTADSRAIQTLLTDFDFPQQWPGQSGSALRVSRDGRTLITLMPSTDEDQERITGSRIDVWDVLSGVPLKRFEVVSRLTDICLPGSESCVFSVPAVSAWPLFENRAAAPLTSAGSIKFLSLPHVELAVCAGVADTEKMRPLIELYDATTIQPLQTRLPEGFNASVRTVQKSEISGRLAFCVTRSDGSNARRHELFVCSIEDLSRFEEIAPLDTIDCSRFEEADGGAGFAALAFSPDGTRLATVAQTKSGAEGFLVRIHQLNSTRSPKPLEMRIPSELQPDRGVERTAFLNGQQKLLIHTSAGLFIGDLRDSERKSARPAISAIRFSTDVSAVTLSDDSRWAVVGTRGGTLQVYDLASSTPEASAPFPPGGAAAHDGTVISLNFSRPVTGVALPLFLASVGRENRIKIWDCTALESILDDAGRDYRKKAKK